MLKRIGIEALTLGLAFGLIAGVAHGQASKRYKETEVTNGGAIHGKVTFKGEPPELKVRITADKNVCAHTDGYQKSPRLRVGEDGGVAETVVFLRGVTEGKKLAELNAPAKLTQTGCVYEPFVQVVPFKGRLEITSQDPINHNIHAVMMGNGRTIMNLASSKGSPQSVPLTRPGIIAVNCDVHAWMSAYYHIVRHPYYAVTGDDGTYELTDVPPGVYELVAWHPSWEAKKKLDSKGQLTGYTYPDPMEVVAEVTVEAGETAEIDFVINE